MEPVIIKWNTGEMHLTAEFFEQAGPKVRKALRMMLDDPEWSAERAHRLSIDLLTAAEEMETNAQNQFNFSAATRQEAKEFRAGLKLKKGQPLPCHYDSLLERAQREKQIGSELLRGAERIRKNAVLLREVWGLDV